MDNKQVIAFFPMTIPASGKTVFIESIRKHYQAMEEAKWEIIVISSDIVQSQLMGQYLLQNPQATHDEAFAECRKSYRNKYESAIKDVCKSIQKSQGNKFVIFFDKNHPENALNSPITILKSKFPNVVMVGVLPAINKPVNKNYFSLCYLVSCIQRAIKRENHETLRGSKEKVAAIVISFFKFFFNLTEINALPFDKVIRIPFTNEIDEKETEFVGSVLPLLREIWASKSPEEIQANYNDQLQIIIQICEANDLGFPQKQEQEEVIHQALIQFDQL